MFSMKNLETKNGKWCWRNSLSAAIVAYLVLIPVSFAGKAQNPESLRSERLETPDIIPISLVFLFNSVIVETLRKR